MLNRQIVLITGGSGTGCGKAIAKRFAATGAQVVINGRSSSALAQVQAELAGAGLNVDYYTADIADYAAVCRMFDYIRNTYGKLDVFVHNAAPASKDGLIGEIDLTDWQDDVSIILGGAFYCCKNVVPFFIQQLSGKIIFISSSAAVRGSWGRSVSYAAAKAGLHGLTKRLALEMGKYRVNVNCIAPSQILTPRVLKGGRKTEEEIKAHAYRFIPLKRTGLPADIASLAYFLSTEEASYITGQILDIDGGSSLAVNFNSTL